MHSSSEAGEREFGAAMNRGAGVGSGDIMPFIDTVDIYSYRRIKRIWKLRNGSCFPLSFYCFTDVMNKAVGERELSVSSRMSFAERYEEPGVRPVFTAHYAVQRELKYNAGY